MIKDEGNHFIDFEVESEHIGRWRYRNFYGCPEHGRRRESWSLLTTLATKSNLSWCVMGDYNDLMWGVRCSLEMFCQASRRW